MTNRWYKFEHWASQLALTIAMMTEIISNILRLYFFSSVINPLIESNGPYYFYYYFFSAAFAHQFLCKSVAILYMWRYPDLSLSNKKWARIKLSPCIERSKTAWGIHFYGLLRFRLLFHFDLDGNNLSRMLQSSISIREHGTGRIFAGKNHSEEIEAQSGIDFCQNHFR